VIKHDAFSECVEQNARNKNIYDAAAAQFTIHITMDVCSVLSTVKGCLPGWVEENTNTGRHTLQHQMALPRRRRRTRHMSVAVGRLDDLH